MNRFEQILYWLIAGSKGGANRARILYCLEKKPMNANMLSKKLGLDYKTVQHHIDILQENQLITSSGKGYGNVYFISPELKDAWQLFKKMFEEKDLGGKT